jgi:hypothetical protein
MRVRFFLEPMQSRSRGGQTFRAIKGRGGTVSRRICAVALLVISLVAGAAARAAEPVAPPCKNGAATCMPWERDWSNTTLPAGSVVTGQGVIYAPPANLIVNFLYNWQTLLGGGIALIAGVLAYFGARQAAAKQIAAVKDQIEDARAASRQADERRLSVINWAVKTEVRRLEISISTLRRALPSAPQATNRLAKQLVIESSPLLTGQREKIALLDDKTRALLERLAGI